MKTERIEFIHKGKWIVFDFTPTESDEWQSDGNYDYHYDAESNEVCVYELTEDGNTRTENSVHSQPIGFHLDVVNAKAILRQAGYFVDNLWHIQDVQINYVCDSETAQKILYKSLTNEQVIERVFGCVEYFANEMNLEQPND